MNIFFYTEAGNKRGMGHLVRCYTIYEKIKESYKNVFFYLDSDINYDYKFDDIIYFKWNNLKYDKKFDIVFIDSYEAGLEIYDKLSENSTILVYIDDNGRLNYPSGIILNFAPDANDLFFKNKNSKYIYLLGLDYIPIRKEFISIKKQKQKQIFIMLGGSDVADLSLDVLIALNNIKIKKVIVSNNIRTINKLEKYKNTTVLYRPSDEELISCMASSSIAISTASMTLYELAYLKVPTIIIAINSNQKIGVNQSIKHKIAIQFINIKDINWQENIENAVLNLKNDMLNNTIDGKGTQRIINSVEKIFKERTNV